MTSIITGDIIDSRKQPTKNWIDGLKQLLGTIGQTPQWEIYRGDEFQLEVANPEQALLMAFRIKAYLRTLQLDAHEHWLWRQNHDSGKISESNGAHLYARANF
jgi:hypothetical protein